MASSKRERMSSVDVAWLRMDRPSNLMMICGVLVFGERVRRERVRATLRDRFLSFARFGQRPVLRAGVRSWDGSGSIDLDYHLRRLALPPPGGKAALQSVVSGLLSEPLDPSRPLWQFHLIERYGEGSALVLRIHHCYADGIALIQVMLSMTDADRSGTAVTPVLPRRDVVAATDLPTVDGDPLSAWLEPASDALVAAKKAGARLLAKGAALWEDPAKAVQLMEQGAALTAELAKLALMGEDSATRFKGKPGIVKRVAWADPLDLGEVKAVGRALACSVNDVLLSAVAGALRTYLVQRGDVVDGLILRALVPVNMRPPEKANRLGNRFGLVFLDLPIGIENPIERLYAVRANMQALKGSYQPLVALSILAAMGAGPEALQERMLALLARNASAVMTNVPGPQQPLYFAGALIESLMFWVPQSGDIGMGVSILSYNGLVQFGLATDRRLCPDPEAVIGRFASEFEQLLLATLLAPWPWQEPPAAFEFEQLAQA